MGNFVEQSYEFAARPVIYNVCNYQKPANGQTALISWDDVITLFHEFGHTLHGLFASQRYATLSGTNTPRDFVEFPSQINEHWASHPQVFAHFARHYQTGEPMPDALREKMLNATQFNKGYDMTELLSAALLDMNWHGIQEPVEDVEAFEAAALKKEGLDLPARTVASPRRTAALSQQLFRPHLRRRLRGRVLRLSLDADAGGRWLPVVCRAGRFDARKRTEIPRGDFVPRQQH